MKFINLNISTIFCLFLIDFRIPQMPKNIGPAEAFEYLYICVLIALETDLGPTFGSILGSQIVPKSVPRGSRKVLKIIACFDSLLGLPRIDFVANMAPMWPQLRTQDGPKFGPKCDPNQSKNNLGSEITSRNDFLILD